METGQWYPFQALQYNSFLNRIRLPLQKEFLDKPSILGVSRLIVLGSKLWQIFHIDLTHLSYTASPFTVRRYLWRGWRGEFGNFIFTKPSVMAGVREYSRKLGRFFKPTASIISFTLFSYVPIATTNRFIFSDNVDAVSSKLVWVLVWVLVWGSSVSLYPISI